MDLIVYHGKCRDGWCAAYVAQKRYPEAELLPVAYGDEPPYEKVVKRDVLVVDFSWPQREVNDTLAASSRSFQILDHHKTAQATLEGAPYVIFDMARSGAGLTWDILFGGPRPWVVDFIEDQDLWNWRLPQSREICAFLGTLAFTKKDWDKLDWTIKSDGNKI